MMTSKTSPCCRRVLIQRD